MKETRIIKHKYSDGTERFDVEYRSSGNWYTFTTRDTIDSARELIEWLTKPNKLVSSEIVE